MALQGNLQDMSVADLIQHNCQDRKTAQLIIENGHRQAILFFKEGAVPHAQMDELEGEEVIYQILGWQNGKFSLEVDLEPPAITIQRSWSGLLLKGAQRLDEESHLSISNSNPLPQEDHQMTKKKSEILAETLASLLRESSDIEGVAVVGVDGLVYSANVPQRTLEEEMVGATSAAILGLSKRSAGQLKRGKFKQTLVQGDEGNIIVSSLNEETLLVGLTARDVNLGMAFAEMRTMTGTLSSLV